MPGSELRAHRKAAGPSHVALARQAGVGRHAVQCWEANPFIARGLGLERLLRAFGLPDYSIHNTRGHGALLATPGRDIVRAN